MIGFAPCAQHPEQRHLRFIEIDLHQQAPSTRSKTSFAFSTRRESEPRIAQWLNSWAALREESELVWIDFIRAARKPRGSSTRKPDCPPVIAWTRDIPRCSGTPTSSQPVPNLNDECRAGRQQGRKPAQAKRLQLNRRWPTTGLARVARSPVGTRQGLNTNRLN